MTPGAVYDRIGKTYDQTRKADPEIARKIIHHLSPTKNGYYLDVGCGSGNYTCAIHENGFRMCGIDISEEMLTKAKQKNSLIQWVQGDARTLAFHDEQFDGAISTLATHHIKDIEQSFQEVFRVISQGRFVIFTSFPEQMKAWWLNRYFPNTMQRSMSKMHRRDRLISALSAAGFRDIQTDKFFISNDLQDWFLSAGKYRPHIYLDPVVRAGMSTFSLEENQEEVLKGCLKLKEDIDAGKMESIIESHESEWGDYVFISCKKDGFKQ